MNRLETGCAVAAMALASWVAVVPASAQPILAGANGMTLYTFDKDSNGQSACYDECAVKWPPYLAEPGQQMPEGWTRVARTDGTEQWALNGKPLYFYIEDTASGEAKGDGLGGVWHTVAAP